MSAQPDSATSPLSETSAEISPEEIIAAIHEAELNWLPWDAIHAANRRRDELTPHLFGFLLELGTAVRCEPDREFFGNGATVALALLAEFQTRDFLSVVVDILTAKNARSELLFHPKDKKLYTRCVASMTSERPEIIEQLLDDEHLGYNLRGDLCLVYWFWVRDGKITRDEAAERLFSRLRAIPESQREEDWPLELALQYVRLADPASVDLEAVAEAAATSVELLTEVSEKSAQNFQHTLSELRETHTGFLTELERLYPDSVEHLASLLNEEYSHNLPKKLLRQLQKQDPPALSQALGQLLRSQTEEVKALGDDEDASYNSSGPVFAIYLLTEKRCYDALPAILEAISLPGEGPFLLFGDFVTEYLNRTLAVLSPGSLSPIDALIRDDKINEYVRSAACGAYPHLVRDGRLSRAEAIAALTAHLEWAIQRQDSPLATALACVFADLGAWEAAELYGRAYDQELIDPSMIGRDSLARTPEAGIREFEKHQARLWPADFDTVDELSQWASYQPRETPAPRKPLTEFFKSPIPPLPAEQLISLAPELAPPGTIRYTAPAVGRNDPCPCGSGKKYKKCCLRGG